MLRREIFQYMKAGDELVEEPFRRLIAAGQLISHPNDGFWACMDTFKEMQELEDLHSRGNAPWTVWNGPQLKKDRMNGETVSHAVPLTDPVIAVG